MGVFLVFFIVNVMVRRKWLAALVACMIWFGGNTGVLSDWIAAMQWGLEFAFLLFLTLRFGLFASVLVFVLVATHRLVNPDRRFRRLVWPRLARRQSHHRRIDALRIPGVARQHAALQPI